MRLQKNAGQSLIVLALSLTALMAFLSLSIDVGRWCVARQKAVNICDMAALGGAQELSSNQQVATRAQKVILDMLDANAGASGSMPVAISHVIGTDNPDIIISGYNDTTATNAALTDDVVWMDSMGNQITRPAPNHGLMLCGKIAVPPLFGRAMGYSDAHTIVARSVVALGRVSNLNDTLQPFGVSSSNIADVVDAPSATVSQPLTYHQWQESWTGSPGAFGLVAPGGQGQTGGDDLRENIAWGCPGEFSVGQYIKTVNGVTCGPVQQGVEERLLRSQYATTSDWLAAFNSNDPVAHANAMSDARVIVVPIVDITTIVLDGNGTADSVKIVGFATYALDRWDVNQKEVLGYFIKSTCDGTVGTSGRNYDTLAVHLL